MNIKIYGAIKETITAWQWEEPGLRNITDTILSIINPNPGKVLDVGCGTGRVALTLANRGFEVDAIDIEPKVIQIAKDIASSLKLQCSFDIGDFTKEEFVKPNYYDLVICSEVIEHVQNYQLVIDNINRTLKSGGILILTTPHGPNQFSIVDVEAGHIRRYTYEQVERSLSKFHIIEHFTTGFPIYRFIRFIYPRILKAVGRKYSREELWSSRSSNKLAKFVYYIIKLDNIFNRLNLGDCLIVKAEKKPVRDFGVVQSNS